MLTGFEVVGGLVITGVVIFLAIDGWMLEFEWTKAAAEPLIEAYKTWNAQAQQAAVTREARYRKRQQNLAIIRQHNEHRRNGQGRSDTCLHCRRLQAEARRGLGGAA